MYSKPPVNLELKTVEEDSMEPENALASESGPLESSSKTQNQEEATKDGPAGCLKASQLIINLNCLVLRCIILISFIRHFQEMLDMCPPRLNIKSKIHSTYEIVDNLPSHKQ